IMSFPPSHRGTLRGPAGPGREDAGKRTEETSAPLTLNLPPVDMELLRSRLISTAATRSVRPNPDVLVFKSWTKTQERQPATQKPVQLETLPEFIQRKNREELISAGWKPRPSFSEGAERTDPTVERYPSAVQLPRIPDHLKERQVQFTQGMLSSSSSPKIPKSSTRGRSVTLAPIIHAPSLPLPNPLLFSSVEEVIHAQIRSTAEILQVIRNNPHLGFLYMTSAVPKSSNKYDAFSFRIVTYKNINKSDYYTMSPDGVMHHCDGQVDFLPLARWEQEYHYHRRLLQIPFFSLFRKWKAFRVWRTNVRSKNIKKCKQSLQERLFIINEFLGPALIDIKEMSYRISDMGLCRMEKEHTYTLQEFTNAQCSQLIEVSSRLEEFRELVKEVAGTACQLALQEAGYIPDYISFESDGAESAESNHHGNMDFFEKKMSFTEQANKRYHCNRLTCFVRLTDYLIMNTMHELVVRSITKILSALQERNTHTPSHTLIQSWVSSESSQDSVPEQSADDSLLPMFITELMLDTHMLSFQPSVDDFQESIAEIISCFQKTVLSLDPLVPDSYFDSFTQPIINKKTEEKMCGEGPSLEVTLKEDQNLQNIISSIKDSVKFAFDAANRYADSFEPFRLFYKENESLDLNVLKEQDHDVGFFEESMEKYTLQQKKALGIKPTRHVGMLLVDTSQLKSKLTPSPLRCLEAINDMLPLLAKRKMDSIIAEAQDAQFRLDLAPTTTTEYVNALNFLEEIQERIEVLDEEMKTVCLMYALIESYSVPTPPEDFAVFATLKPSVAAVRSAIDKALGEKEANVVKFCELLQQDINELNKEVMNVRQRAENSQILDIDADRGKVRMLLGEIQISIDELQTQAFSYKSYQTNFKVDVTKYESLEELSAEVKLKHLLWDALEEWDSLQNDWMQTKFDELDPELLTTQVYKYGEYVSQLEKGLPPNSVVPRLKAGVEFVREKLPVISVLRNPCLKAHHWDTLESIVGCSLLKQPLTLSVLQELNIFTYSHEIQQVSDQASGEAALEAVLKKVEDSWKTTEFVVLPHRDCKDVFILGETDDIQVLLEDSSINIDTVASSLYVGPMKARVDEWQRLLNLFRQTLEEWLTCQRNWLHLESMFGAPKIQRQLPAEAKKFMQVDKSWKEIMRNVNRLPNALRAATQPGLLQTFQDNNALLDQVQKSVEAYLESKSQLP
ncbi:dynein heavy chain 6, axonemal, partial [Astyanax mexicanus]